MNENLRVYSKKKKIALIRRIILIAIPTLIMLGIALWLSLTKFFVVTKIEIAPTNLYPAETILEAAAIPEKKPLIQIAKHEIKRKIEESFPYLEDVTIDFDLPGTVIIGFTEDIGKLGLKLGDDLFAIDCELNVIHKEISDGALERIELITDKVSRCVVGEKLAFTDDNHSKILLSLIESLEKEGMLDHVSQINMTDRFDIRIMYLDRFELMIGDEKDLAIKFAMAKGVISDQEPDAVGRIDLADPNNAYLSLRGREVTNNL